VRLCANLSWSDLAHGRRKFSELDEAFPAESAVVVNALKDVFDHDEYARAEQMTAQEL
jgi:hypothetical protein